MRAGKHVVLLVEDEPSITAPLTEALARDGFETEVAGTAAEARELAERVSPDLILLDLMLPDGSGFDVCRDLRRTSDVPIIMLTARGDEADRIVGLELGADDYIAKPFNPRELVARVKAVLRRSDPAARRPAAIDVGDLHVDVAGREVRIAGKPVQLRAKEFDLLVALAQNVGVAMARDRLLNMVWGENFFGDARTLDVHIAWLREKIATATPKIVTVWGFGYKLVEQSEQA